MKKRVSLSIVVGLAMMLAIVLAAVVGGCKKKPVVTVPVAETTQTAAATAEEPAGPPVWPFTGVLSDEATAVLVRPVSVKIENSVLARPQMGVNAADVVYETIAEGGITRWNCLFHSHLPKEVGPVRSARLSDMWIVPQYGDGLFFFSGSNSQVNRRIKKRHLADLSHGRVGTAMYHRVGFRHAPHNLYLDVAKAYKVAAKKKFAVAADAPYPGLAFGELSGETTVVATQLTVPFSPYFKMKWTYNEKKGVYERWTNNKKQFDSDGKRMRADNVVVLWANYTLQKKKDPAGNGTYDIKLGGEGLCAVFRDGQRIDGSWKADRTAPPKFFDTAGNEIKLHIGRTWFEVPPTDSKISSK